MQLVRDQMASSRDFPLTEEWSTVNGEIVLLNEHSDLGGRIWSHERGTEDGVSQVCHLNQFW